MLHLLVDYCFYNKKALVHIHSETVVEVLEYIIQDSSPSGTRGSNRTARGMSSMNFKPELSEFNTRLVHQPLPHFLMHGVHLLICQRALETAVIDPVTTALLAALWVRKLIN